MGSIYVIKYQILVEIVDLGQKAPFAIKDPEIVNVELWINNPLTLD